MLILSYANQLLTSTNISQNVVNALTINQMQLPWQRTVLEKSRHAKLGPTNPTKLSHVSAQRLPCVAPPAQLATTVV